MRQQNKYGTLWMMSIRAGKQQLQQNRKNIDYWDAMINASWIVFSTDSIKMHKNQHTRKEWDEKMKIQCLRCLYCQKE